MKNHENHESFPPRKFCRIQYMITKSINIEISHCSKSDYKYLIKGGRHNNSPWQIIPPLCSCVPKRPLSGWESTVIQMCKMFHSSGMIAVLWTKHKWRIEEHTIRITIMPVNQWHTKNDVLSWTSLVYQQSSVRWAETWSNFCSDAVIRNPQFNSLCSYTLDKI